MSADASLLSATAGRRGPAAWTALAIHRMEDMTTLTIRRPTRTWVTPSEIFKG